LTLKPTIGFDCVLTSTGIYFSGIVLALALADDFDQGEKEL